MSMRIRVTYRNEFMPLDITDLFTVKDIKEIVRLHFYIGPDGGAGSLEGNEKKILTLQSSGSNLEDHWFLTDLGIKPGTTIKAVLIAEVKPVIYIYSAFNEETLPIIDKIPVPRVTVAEIRALTTRKTGIPVGVFRLTYENKELFDCHYLDDYNIDVGDTLRMETWDGWSEFLSMAIIGYTAQTFKRLSNDEVVARFQMKVAMYIAAHFGHVDLAVSLMRQGIRADEAVGDHPLRMWCKGEEAHIDSKKAPVHESSESGQLGVLRCFVNQSVCNVLARDGNDLTPLNIALRKKQKPCASFLLTKQWSKVNYTDKAAIPLSIFVKIKRWGDRSKDKVLLMHGQWKSSIKNPRRHGQPGALISNGIQLDGFTGSKMNSKNSKTAKTDEDRERKRNRRLFSGKDKKRDFDHETYFKQQGTMQNFKLPRLSRLGKTVTRHNTMNRLQSMEDAKSDSKSSDGSDTQSQGADGSKRMFRPRSSSNSAVDRVRLPPIKEQGKVISSSQHNLTTTGRSDTEGSKTKSSYIQTGGKAAQPSDKVFRSTPSTSTHSHGSSDSRVPSEAGAPKPHRADAVPVPKVSNEAPTKKKKERKITSAAMIAKAKTSDGSLPLPASSIECNPKPFFHDFSGDIPGRTLALYERYRGYRPREYAIRCLTIANSFKDKPWLQQVRQAVLIARNGVEKTILNKPTIFATEKAQTEQRCLEQKKLSANALGREAGQAVDRPGSAADESVVSMATLVNEGQVEDMSYPISTM